MNHIGLYVDPGFSPGSGCADRDQICSVWTHFLETVIKSLNLVEVAGAPSLQELFVSAHRDAERVDHLVPIMLCCGDDVNVFFVQMLNLFLKKNRTTGRVSVSL